MKSTDMAVIPVLPPLGPPWLYSQPELLLGRITREKGTPKLHFAESI